MDQQTRALMEQMAENAAEAAVTHTLLSLGIDSTNPIEAQKDMAGLWELRGLIEDPEMQKDLLHLRRWRKTMDSVESKGFLTTIGLVCFGGITLVLYAFRIKIFGVP